jgi:DNA-binding IclR family transcriptional regulator
MELTPVVALFGNKTSALILLYLQNYREGSIAGIARAFAMNKNRVYVQLLKLEKAGLLVARSFGNQRVFSINPRFVAKDELAKLLEKLLRTMDEDEFDKYFAERRRPRRTKKAL